MKIITIIGDKGVGKTTLFRQLIRRFPPQPDKSQFSPSPVINYAENLIKIDDNIYRLIDTPAFIFSPQNEIEKGIKKQTEDLLKTSDLICWIIDQKDERAFALKKYLKNFSAPQILIFNQKNTEEEEEFFSYSSLGLQHFLAISARKNANLDKLSQKIIALLPDSADEKTDHQDKELKLLIFGPPNSGKSTLMNYLLQENRSLATPIAGTTQEPVISDWNWQETLKKLFQQTKGTFSEDQKIDFELVDTAGITKEQKLKEKTWKNCDLAWAILDATLPLTKQILQIVNLGEKHNKPLIIIINKCDLLAEKKEQEAASERRKKILTEPKKELEKELRNRLKSLSYVPIIFLSALQGTGMKALLKVLKEMLTQAQKKASKKELAEIVEKMVISHPPKYFKGNKLKIYFAKQEHGLTQTFIFFVNNPQWAHFSYQRYMANYLRKSLNLPYLPIKIILKKSE
ncbi:GTPase Der [endosymbiont DhMRE of Dentiscutata heterogama]|uniref:GTPase n=1 Tax=endosymbiont DhMRE of Dentiscutata heterogama TaxID=1609546 RepID=UPI000629DA5D|nr:GTPase [endosymbiont DhMRE of Dentiscutata heterogama]CFW93020.1 GTPase Der [endosymbiont DhMRE of Dentiscutata heterogama]